LSGTNPVSGGGLDAIVTKIKIGQRSGFVRLESTSALMPFSMFYFLWYQHIYLLL